MLIAERAGERNAVERAAAGAIDLARRANLRQAGARNVEEPQQLLVPLQRLEIHQLRARGVGRVGEMAPGQIPGEPGIHRAEQHLAGLRLLARAGNGLEQPDELQAREISGERQAGLGAQPILAALRGEARDQRLGARVHPDDRVVQRRAGVAVPEQRRLALIGEADAGEIAVARGPPWRARRRSSPPYCARFPARHARPSRAADRFAHARAGRARRSRRRRSKTMKRVLVVP